MLETWMIANSHLRPHLLRAQAERNAVLRAVLGRLGTGIAGAVRAVAGPPARAFIRWRGKRAMIRELSALDDRMLKDIGVYRGDILSLAESTWSEPKQPTMRGRPPAPVAPLDPKREQAAARPNLKTAA